MKLFELEDNSIVDVEAHLGNDCVKFSSKVLFSKSRGIVIDTIKYDGKIISFKNINLNICVINDNENNGPVVWKNCKIKQISYKDKIYHLITCAYQSETYNRRECVRIKAVLSGKAKFGTNRNNVPIKIYDVSESGFSLISSEDIEYYKDFPVVARYEDIETGVAFTLQGSIVRREEFDEDLYLYGCKLTVPVNALMKFIVYKIDQESV